MENFSLVVRSKDTSRLIKGLTTKIEETEEAIKTVTAEIAESALERPKLTLAEKTMGGNRIWQLTLGDQDRSSRIDEICGAQLIL